MQLHLENTVGVKTIVLVRMIAQDLHFSGRMLARKPYPESRRLTVVWSAFGAEGRAPSSGPELVSLRERSLSALPGVQSVGVVSHLPFDDNLPNWYSYFWREGAPQQEQNTLMADHRSVLAGFFDSLGVTFVAGRNFDTSDERTNRKVVIIDDLLAKQLWPGKDATGKLLNVENGDFVRDVAEVVGVVRHVQYHSLANPVRPQLYLPYAMAVRENMSFTVRSKSEPEFLIPLIRQEMANLDKDLPVANVRPYVITYPTLGCKRALSRCYAGRWERLRCYCPASAYMV